MALIAFRVGMVQVRLQRRSRVLGRDRRAWLRGFVANSGRSKDFALIAFCVKLRALGILGVKMEPSDFAGWLTALTSLNAAQRRIVFRELALAEADDPCEEGIEIFVPGPAAADADRAEERGEATATAFCESGARDIFREIAKERHSRWGCPRCGARAARPWGEARGLPRYRCESFKGRRSGLARPARRRGGKAAKRGLSAEQIPVIVARDRSGATLDAVLP